jgi:predicted DNA-binding transcriptional regulator YafY
VSPATLKRDLAYLRDQLGAPIVYERFANAYRFEPEPAGGAARGGGARHELPGLWFDERELYALLMAHQLLGELDQHGTISRHLQPLVERIHQLLASGPDGQGSASDAKALLRRVRIFSPARRPVPGAFFELVGEALTRRRRIAMSYLTRSRNESAEREVSPQRLVHYRNTWYLDAWCHTRERLLRFALDAIQHATVRDARAKDVALRQVEAEMDGGYGIYAGSAPYRVTLEFAAHAAQWVSREEWHPAQQGVLLADGRWRLTLPYADPTELAMDILRHAGQVRVVEDSGGVGALVRQKLEAFLADDVSAPPRAR